MITEQTLLDELLASDPAPLDPVTEVCSSMLVERSGLKEGAWQHRLRNLEQKGLMTCRLAMYNGHVVKAYRKVNNEPLP